MNKILELKNICKSFGDKKVHQGVSFSLFEGETIGLLGPSGTGKSVLLRSIIGLEDIDDGEVFFHGKKIDHLPEDLMYEVRKKISYAFQTGALFDSDNVFENVAYPLFEHTQLSEDEVEKKVREMLSLVNMEESFYLMPADLSGGMQKRIGLARSLILKPEVILYDEPTAGLDPLNIELVISIMDKIKKRGLSSILVTHDVFAAKKICDRILMLKDGKICFNGTFKEFENSKNEFIQKFLLSQWGKNANKN